MLLALLLALSVQAQDPEPSLHPLCLWEHPRDENAVEECVKNHAPDRVDYRQGYFISPLRDPANPALPDEIRDLQVGKLDNGDEVFMVSSLRYGDRMDGTEVLIWRKAGAGPGGVQVLVSNGFRAQGGITDVSLQGDKVEVGISFDTAWNGINDNWAGLPPGWNRLPAFGAGCATCAMGIAHVIYPERGHGQPVLNSVELDTIPQDSKCRSLKVGAMADYLPHAFTPDQFGELIRSLRDCG